MGDLLHSQKHAKICSTVVEPTSTFGLSKLVQLKTSIALQSIGTSRTSFDGQLQEQYGACPSLLWGEDLWGSFPGDHQESWRHGDLGWSHLGKTMGEAYGLGRFDVDRCVASRAGRNREEGKMNSWRSKLVWDDLVGDEVFCFFFLMLLFCHRKPMV